MTKATKTKTTPKITTLDVELPNTMWADIDRKLAGTGITREQYLLTLVEEDCSLKILGSKPKGVSDSIFTAGLTAHYIAFIEAVERANPGNWSECVKGILRDTTKTPWECLGYFVESMGYSNEPEETKASAGVLAALVRFKKAGGITHEDKFQVAA